MVNEIKNNLKKLDKLTKKIMKKGLIFCSLLGIIGLIILITYNFYTEPTLFWVGSTIFKLSLNFSVEFIICGFVVDKIKNDHI